MYHHIQSKAHYFRENIIIHILQVGHCWDSNLTLCDVKTHGLLSPISLSDVHGGVKKCKTNNNFLEFKPINFRYFFWINFLGPTTEGERAWPRRDERSCLFRSCSTDICFLDENDKAAECQIYPSKASHSPAGHAGPHGHTLRLDLPLTPALFERQHQEGLLDSAPSSVNCLGASDEEIDFQWFGHESSPWLSFLRGIIYVAKCKRKLPGQKVPQNAGGSPGLFTQLYNARNLGEEHMTIWEQSSPRLVGCHV